MKKIVLTHLISFLSGAIIAGVVVYDQTSSTEVLIVNDEGSQVTEEDSSLSDSNRNTESSHDLVTSTSSDAYSVEISQEQYDCALEILGQERLNEIIAGDQPGLLEMSKLVRCI